MRNTEEENHSETKDVLESLNMCEIVCVSRGSYSDFTEEVGYDGEPYPATENEFEVYNKNTISDPLVLTADELRRLGQQLIEMANSVTNQEDAVDSSQPKWGNMGNWVVYKS
jgi:hypothetical protein